jgi:hypothetical protein
MQWKKRRGAANPTEKAYQEKAPASEGGRYKSGRLAGEAGAVEFEAVGGA